MLQSFNAPFNLSGIALDYTRDTMFLMRADGPGGADGPFDDEVYEFTFTGNNLGLVIPGSDFVGNGLGLEYLPEVGRLYATQQTTPPGVLVFEDPSRVPEPGAALVLIGSSFAALQRLQRHPSSLNRRSASRRRLRS